MDQIVQSLAECRSRPPPSPAALRIGLSPVQVLALELGRRRRAELTIPEDNVAGNTPPPRATSYHNVFRDTSKPLLPNTSPPSYARTTLRTGCRSVTPREEEGRETLPDYSCSLYAEGLFERKLELASPFEASGVQGWTAVYIILSGTSLHIYKPRLLNRSGPGRHIKSFTLQHAEVGLAGDDKRTIYFPKRPVATLVPEAARPGLWRKDPTMFEERTYYVMRLRLETEQFLLTCPDLFDWLEWISMGIDIATPLDERSMPRFHTLPRRMRNRNAEQGPAVDAEATAADALIRQQERLIRERFPHLADDVETPRPTLDLPRGAPANSAERPRAASPDPDYEDLDLTFARTNEGLSNTASSAVRPLSMFSVLEEASLTPDHTGPRPDSALSTRRAPQLTDLTERRPSNFNSLGKWQPPNIYTLERHLRYRHRIAPVLNFDTPRASDIVMHEGNRMKIDFQQQTLIPYQAKPPSYKCHGFATSDHSDTMTPTTDATTAMPAIPESVEIHVVEPGSLTPASDGSQEIYACDLRHRASPTPAPRHQQHLDGVEERDEDEITPLTGFTPAYSSPPASSGKGSTGKTRGIMRESFDLGDKLRKIKSVAFAKIEAVRRWPDEAETTPADRPESRTARRSMQLERRERKSMQVERRERKSMQVERSTRTSTQVERPDRRSMQVERPKRWSFERFGRRSMNVERPVREEPEMEERPVTEQPGRRSMQVERPKRWSFERFGRRNVERPVREEPEMEERPVTERPGRRSMQVERPKRWSFERLGRRSMNAERPVGGQPEMEEQPVTEQPGRWRVHIEGWGRKGVRAERLESGMGRTSMRAERPESGTGRRSIQVERPESGMSMRSMNAERPESAIGRRSMQVEPAVREEEEPEMEDEEQPGRWRMHIEGWGRRGVRAERPETGTGRRSTQMERTVEERPEIEERPEVERPETPRPGRRSLDLKGIARRSLHLERWGRKSIEVEGEPRRGRKSVEVGRFVCY